jgi:prophage antirepressor-like protein
MSEIVPFEYGTNTVRATAMPDGSVELSANDVCDVLGIADRKQALERLDDDEKGYATMDTPGGRQRMATVTESGLYTLILRSNKPDARMFRRWVTHDVLPSIRRTGRYELPADSVTVPALLALADGAPHSVRTASHALALALSEEQAPPASEALPEPAFSIRAHSGVEPPAGLWTHEGEWIEAVCDDPPSASTLGAHLVRRTAATDGCLELVMPSANIIRFRHRRRG